jgi:hypothetical protein
MKKIVFVLIISLIIVNFVSAKSSEMFIDYLTDEVYDSCAGKNLNIKEPFIQDTLTNESVTLIPWPYDKLILRRIIELLGNYEPWDFFHGTCDNKGISMGGSKDGCGILSCENNKLDINQYTYFWNDERVDVPQEYFKTVYGDNIETGDNSQVTTGDNSPINQTDLFFHLFWSKGTIGGIILSGIVWLITRIIWLKVKSIKKHKLIKRRKSKK